MSAAELIRPGSASAAVVRQEFGATELQRSNVGSTMGEAVAAQMQAIVQAKFIVAMQRPRNMERVRLRMIDECKRPEFAVMARYRKPVGRKLNQKTGQWEDQFAEGWSIRFAEMAKRNLGNISDDALPLHDDENVRVVLMSVTDLETNNSYSMPVTLAKTVERKSLKKGQDAIGERTNSKGDKVYIVEATNDEVNMRQNSEWSKFQRNVLRSVPGDVLDACLKQYHKTLADEDAKDPNEAKRKLIDAFHEIGVEPADIEAFLGQPLDKPLQPAQFGELRGVWVSMKDGETSWEEIMLAKNPSGSAEAAQKVAADKLAAIRQQKPTTPVETKSTPVATASGPKPKKISEADAAKLIALAENMGLTPEGFAKIITDHGFKSPYEITEGESWSSIYRAVEGTIETGARQAEDETQEQPPEAEQPQTTTTARKPQFGQRGK